jgi:hypothetical protein
LTNEERHINRYKRRKAKRDSKKLKFYKSLPSYEEIFSFKNLYDAFNKCKRNVMWKRSVQIYKIDLPYNLSMLREKLLSGKWKTKGFIEFDINERGKTRHIQSVNIEERIIQRCLCDNFLIPLLSHNIIKDNSATLKNKGIHFAINRLKHHLEDFYRIHNTNEGYVLLFDFSDYYNSIDHKLLYEKLDKMILDERTKKLVHNLIDVFGDYGLGLGSQVSQILAVTFPNIIDHTFKDRYKVKGYGRYMDDGYLIFKDLKKVKKSKRLLYAYAKKLNLKLNEKKFKICKISKSFTYLKKRFFLDKNGEVVIRLSRKNITLNRRKFKRMSNLLDEKKIEFKHVRIAYNSFCGFSKHYNTYKTLNSMNELYDNLFITPFVGYDVNRYDEKYLMPYLKLPHP